MSLAVMDAEGIPQPTAHHMGKDPCVVENLSWAEASGSCRAMVSP